MAVVQNMFPRSRFARYITAAVCAVFVISTLYYLEVPAQYSAGHPTGPIRHWSSAGPMRGGSLTPAQVWDDRAAQVKNAFLHSYGGYLKYAEGYDELRPVANHGSNNFNGWNVTVYDSLDTMILMGLWDEFAATLPMVEQADFRQLHKDGGSQYAPFFETVIRSLGGLLSAYALSGEAVLLDSASRLATLLEPAFDTPKGVPVFGVNPGTGKGTATSSSVLAEIASCQMEWLYAAHATGNKTHYDRASKLINTLADAMEQRKGGMLPTNWHTTTGKPMGESRSMGAAADSGHEYLLKQYLLTGKTDTESLEMYLLTINEVLSRLVYITPGRELVYVTQTSGTTFTPDHNFEHLACFFPGLLALGAHTLDLNLAGIDPRRLNAEARRQYELMAKYDLRALHMAAAEALATSCWLMYADQPSGLGPEVVRMDKGGKLWMDAVEEWYEGGRQGPLPGLGEKKPIKYDRPDGSRTPAAPWDYAVQRTDYFLRPETLESIYIMWRTTGNPVWRERGWEIFQALERETKTASGYTSLKKVTQSPAVKGDEQPSYFLAETLKYLYLMFRNEDLVPLDKWVFNTEAHPFPVFSWNSWEKHKFGITY